MTYIFTFRTYLPQFPSGRLGLSPDTFNALKLSKDSPEFLNALDLIESLTTFQIKPWVLFTADPAVNRSLLGLLPKPPALDFPSALSLPLGYPSFTPAKENMSLLETMERRFYTNWTDLTRPPSYLAVPFFDFLGIEPKAIDDYFYKVIPEWALRIIL